MNNEQKLENLKKEHGKYERELEELQLSKESDKEYKDTLVTIDEKLAKSREKLDNSYNKILKLQEKIALELKARRL